MRTKYRLGVDAGGTFTDFVLTDATGPVLLNKTASTPHDPTEAISTGLALIAEEVGESPAEIISQCDLCINGTTVGLNALIQHRGAKTGLICTAGHEDSIEIRLGHKEDGYRYDTEYPPATMLVPRYLRCGVAERIASNGKVMTPLNEADVRAACELFIAEGVEAVAISFLWSVLHLDHERRAAEIVREMMPDIFLTVGSELYPQIREYTRTSTAITNAYLGPILKGYVEGIDAYFRNLGAEYPVRFFQSNGGLAIGKAMTDRAVYAINSGPASAPQAGLYVSEPFGFDNHRRYGWHLVRHHADRRRQGIDAYFRNLGAEYPVRFFQSNGGLAIGKAMTDDRARSTRSIPAPRRRRKPGSMSPSRSASTM